MGYKQEKHGSVYSASPVSPAEPLSAISQNSQNSQYLSEFEKKDRVRQVSPRISILLILSPYSKQCTNLYGRNIKSEFGSFDSSPEPSH